MILDALVIFTVERIIEITDHLFAAPRLILGFAAVYGAVGIFSDESSSDLITFTAHTGSFLRRSTQKRFSKSSQTWTSGVMERILTMPLESLVCVSRL